MRQLLRDIAEIGAGQGAPQGDSSYCNDGIPFIKAGNMEDLSTGGSLDDIQKVSEEVARAHKLKLYPKGTVLFAKSGMSCLKGYVYVLQCETYVVSHLACITPHEDISEYLRYYFTYHKPNKLVKDPAYPSISLADIGNLEIDTKDAKERDSIISTLNSAEAIIDLRMQELRQLDNLIKARFVEMFEQGDYPQIEFGEICEFLRNGANIKQTKGAAGYPITRIETLANDVFNTDRLGYADIFELGRYEGYLLKPGDILISHINSVAYLGRAVQYRGQMASPIIHGMNLLCARIIDGYNPTFIEFFFRTPIAKEYISSITKKAVNQASITTSDLKKMRVPAPSLEKQNEFDRFVQQIDKSKVVVQKALDEAQLLFDSLMQKYFG